MKLKNYLKIGVLSVGAAIFYSSCGDSFLETPLQNAITSDILSANQAGVDASLISTYKVLNGMTNTIGNVWGAAPSNYIYNSATDDQHKGSEPSDNPDGYYEIGLFQWSGGLKVLNDKYKMVYEGVSRANKTIILADKLSAADASTAAANKIVKAEAKFLRAHYHFEAWKMWKNVPYYTEAEVLAAEIRKPNTADIIPNIIADLDAAIADLPATKTAVGRSDKTVATAYKGKVLMFKKDFAGAKAAFDAVISSGKYALQPCFQDLFTIATQNGKESIFALQAAVKDGDGDGNSGNALERLAAPHSGSHTGCCGFNNPTQDLANSYQVDANGLPLANWNSKTIKVGSADPVDPRIDWTMGRTGVPYLDWGLHSDGWIRGNGWAGFYSPKKNMKYTGDVAGASWNNNQISAKNIEFIRYADVLLMAAEAEVEIGSSLEKAREYVNLVRKRAGTCAQGTGAAPVSITDPSITWAKYSVKEYPTAWTDKNAARDAVRRERRLELATEGHRIFDLRRWANIETTMAAFRTYEKTQVKGALDAAQPIEAKHYLFPLPTREVDLGAGAIVQNPGY
jgi:starch-binding outer membrane protein, SusD/RagB family